MKYEHEMDFNFKVFKSLLEAIKWFVSTDKI